MSSVIFTRGWSPTPRVGPRGSEKRELWCKPLWGTDPRPHVSTQTSVSSGPENMDTYSISVRKRTPNINSMQTLLQWMEEHLFHFHQFCMYLTMCISRTTDIPMGPSPDQLWQGWQPEQCSSVRPTIWCWCTHCLLSLGCSSAWSPSAAYLQC